MNYNALPGLKPEDFEHPGEKPAMAVLRKIPLLDIVLAKYFDMQVHLSAFAEATGSYFRITEKTNPRVHKIYRLAMERLDIKQEYPLFCKLNYDFNAAAVGVDDPFIYIHSSAVANYTDEELLYLLGHELGHIKCGHVLYYGLAHNINSILASLGGYATAAAVGIQYAILDWQRKAEYTADRAGMIAAGGAEPVLSGTMKLLGRSDDIPYIDFSSEKVLKQIEDFECDTADLVGKLLYVTYTAKASHPWSVLRLKQIKDWNDSGEFEKVIKKYH